MKDIENLNPNHPLNFIAKYVGGYEEPEQAFEEIDFGPALKHALNTRHPTEWRALAAIDIWCAVHFCFGIEYSEKGPRIRVPSEIWRSARRIALSQLLKRRVDEFDYDYSLDLEDRQVFLADLITDKAAAHLLYHFVIDPDELQMAGHQMSAIELDEVFKESRRRLHAIWPYLDIIMRIPLTPSLKSAKTPSIENVYQNLQVIYNEIPKNQCEYSRQNVNRDFFNNTIARSRPMFGFIYAIYGLGIYGRKIPKFNDADFCANFIRFTTRPERLHYIAELYDDLRTLFPDSLPIELPSNIVRKQVPRRPLQEKIAKYF